MNLEEATVMTRHQEKNKQPGVSPVEPSEEELLEEEEDVGVLRLMRLQAAMKEKHIVESEG
ncbi:MAG: hypothetical protein AMJ66_05900 [Betaproteobacteria bacterium SG8_40]|jgi:hypothetical protein|nr:MAG: hypothetical protein AMJ66_05900 [Betaproteobacteria bacterium SG8_40]